MDIKISPNKLYGKVSIPSSKSATHRALICAALSDGKSVLNGISFSDDINATISALE
ncbi:MAG: 3-phosphoshikimate 1-carboxyvinyltransferase, partial [Clostridiales bacterium]|nr:3-phosphoshikimate 1-carboxyvinyltransferase [Clostridiales bacterium]